MALELGPPAKAQQAKAQQAKAQQAKAQQELARRRKIALTAVRWACPPHPPQPQGFLQPPKQHPAPVASFTSPHTH